jgi:heme exporter protein D
MASAHPLYIAAAYGVSAIAILALVAWILLDQRARRRELVDLEKRGIRRRSSETAG